MNSRNPHHLSSRTPEFPISWTLQLLNFYISGLLNSWTAELPYTWTPIVPISRIHELMNSQTPELSISLKSRTHNSRTPAIISTASIVWVHVWICASTCRSISNFMSEYMSKYVRVHDWVGVSFVLVSQIIFRGFPCTALARVTPPPPPYLWIKFLWSHSSKQLCTR